MKTIIALTTLVFGLSAFANTKELECKFKRTVEGESGADEHSFRLMDTRPAWEKSFRIYGLKARVEGESVVFEVREEKKIKVVTASLRNPWTKERDPSEPQVEFDFGNVKSVISCR